MKLTFLLLLMLLIAVAPDAVVAASQAVVSALVNAIGELVAGGSR